MEAARPVPDERVQADPAIGPEAQRVLAELLPGDRASGRGEAGIMGEKEGDLTRLDRTTFDAAKMSGQACIRGLRIPVATVVRCVAAGMIPPDIVAAYPDLEGEDVRQSLEYAARLAEERWVPGWPAAPAFWPMIARKTTALCTNLFLTGASDLP
jgi:uncharacterized protein (DUF433 family)